MVEKKFLAAQQRPVGIFDDHPAVCIGGGPENLQELFCFRGGWRAGERGEKCILDEVLEQDQERIALVQQWFGYCLMADTTQQRFVVAVGEGENGKSVMLDLLTAVLGVENVSHVPVEVFAQRFQLTMTLGKLANIMEKIIEGKLKTWFAEGVLLEQPIANQAKYDKKTVGQLLNGAGLELSKFVRLKVGEVTL